MSQQNLLAVGFNVADLQAQATEVERIVTELYKKLGVLDDKKLSPIDVTGLQQLTSSIQQQQQQIEKLNTSVSGLVVAMAEYKKLLDQTTVAEQKAALAETDAAKANAAAKVQLQEKNRLLKEEAEANNALTQNRKRNAEARRKMEEDEAELNRLIALEDKERKKVQDAEDKRLAAEKTARDKQYVKDYEKLLKQKDAADKKSDADQKKRDADTARQKALEGKNALKLNDARNQLEARKKDLEARLANAVYFNAPKEDQKGLANELKSANSQIAEIDKALEKAGSGGAANLGRSLNSAMGSVRQLAYILPGLGIAGIFNLAFEAIVKVVETMGLFNDETQEAIDKETILLDHVEKLNKAIKGRAEALALADKNQVDYYKNQKELAEARGENYSQQVDDVNNVLNAEKNLADQQLKRLGFTQEEYDKLNNEVNRFNEQQKTQLLEVNRLDKEIEKEKNRQPDFSKVAPQDMAASALVFSATQEKAVRFLKNRQDDILKLAGLSDKQSAVDLQRFNDLHDAKKNLDEADQNIEKTKLERSKYYYDEEQKIILSNAEYKVEVNKRASQAILDNELSTRDERIAAITSIEVQDEKLAKAKYDNVINKIGVTESEVVEATNTYNAKLIDIDNDATTKRTKVIVDFYLREQEMIHKAKQNEILLEQISDKTVMDNDQETYEKRIGYLMEYIADRTQIITNQYNKDVENANKTIPKDILPAKLKELETEFRKQVVDIENGVRSDAYQITQSWFNKQYKLIKESSDENRTQEENAATQELLALNTSLNNKTISYKKFYRERDRIEREAAKKIADAKVQDDLNDLKELEDLQAKNGEKLRNATVSFSIATIFGSKKDIDIAKGQIQGLQEDMTKTGKEIEAKKAETGNDSLKALQLRNKDEEDAIKKTNENWAKLEEEVFKGAQQVVDSYFEDRITKLQELTEAQDAATEAEIAAIERSTISAKEKNAYEIQLNAQKTARDEEAARKEKKIKHDQAVFDRDVAMAQIALNTAVAITGALKQFPGPVGIGLAISYGALGAAQLAIAAATKIPEYAKGGTHTKDGLAIFGEAGAELVKEPHKKPYIAERATLAHLAAGTELFPLYGIPQFPEKRNDGWAQTMYLGKQIAKSKREIKNVFKPKITVDLGKELYIRRILHG